MKKLFFLLTACTAALCASATVRYVAPTGDNANDGLSWATAKASVKTAVNASSSGDEVYVAAGTYNETISLKDGVSIRGGYNATTGTRDIENYKSILDGMGLGKFLIVKYDNDCTNPTLIEGLILQNTEYSGEGGGAFIRGNVIMDHCIVRNCKGSGGGGVYANASNAATPAIIRNTTIELCEATSSGGGAYLYKNAVMENCIVRGNSGKYGAVRLHNAGCIIRNTVLYNNTCSVDGWPGSAGIYNEAGGLVENCTVVNNQGKQYAGIHSVDQVYNSVFWGNRDEEGDADPANFISGESNGSSNNWADEGFDGESFTTYSMSRNNMDADGPQFNNPTTFVGVPQNAGEIAAMRAADWSLLSTSPLIDKGRADKAPATDILGVARPVGNGVDVGAYEYNPNAQVVAVTGVEIYEDTLFVIKEQVVGATAIIAPANATNKRLLWAIDDPTIASVDDNGGITGLTEDTTIVRVTTVDGNFTDFAVVVVLPIPPTKYPDEVLAADTMYKQEDYTVPSWMPFLIAKEAARIDSLNPESDLPSIAGKIAEMNAAAGKLVPKEEPYNMIANINGDPSTRMAFAWFTNGGIEQGSVQLVAKADAVAADFEQGNGVITIHATPTTTKPLNYAVSTSGIIKAAKMDPKTKFTYVSHKAIAENLQPGQVYSWRVGFAGHWSEIAQFRTMDAEQGEYSFIYMTDSHIMDQEYVDNARWCATAAAAHAGDARFCLFPGDFVETGTNANSEWEWERWFEESIKPVIMKMPIVPTDGNHDDSDNFNYTYHFNTDNAFNQTAKTKPQFEGITYSFVYGDVLFMVYSLQDWWRAGGSSASARRSTYLSTDLKNWFYDQVEAHPNVKYRVTLAHKNIFSGSGHSVDEETPMFRDIMLPIFADCQIDLAIQGHDHCYEVIGPVDPWTRTVVEGAVSNVDTVTAGGHSANMTGYKNGEYVTDDGTLYFIGATCGRKRYDPYSRAKMEEYYNKHLVQNYFDLFTGFFGQPGAPSFTKFTVKADCIEMNSYTADKNGNVNLINTMKVKRTTPHTPPTGIENTVVENVKDGEKFIRDGQLFILRDGKVYNMMGVQVQ